MLTGDGDATIELAETYYKHTDIELHEDGGKLSLFDYFLCIGMFFYRCDIMHVSVLPDDDRAHES